VSVRLHLFNLRRAASIPGAALLLPVAHSVPRRRQLWAFGYAQGYKDNPRYLFEHVAAHPPAGVEPVWFAQTAEEEAAVLATGRRAMWKRRPRAWWTQLRAGVAVLGNGPSDLNRGLMGRTRVIQTWHGAPFKHIHADFPEGDSLLPGGSAMARRGNDLIRRATNRARSKTALIPSQSAVVAQRYQSAFTVGPEATPVIGTPRADVIGASGPEAEAEARAARDAVLPAALHGVRRFLFYAPTWRDGTDESFLADGFEADALDDLLRRHDAALLVKMHPEAKQDVFRAAARSERIIVSGAGAVDVNVLLRAVDLLVTDYSAISVDYALLDRPIVYFMPDLEAYESGRGLYESPSVLTGGLHCRTWPEVIASIDAALTEPELYLAAVRSTAQRYWAHHDTCNCERITEEILRVCGLTSASEAAMRR
jgi:CDP-glycerol glycerophosphotransferase